MISVSVHTTSMEDNEFGHTVYKHDDGSVDFITINLGKCKLFFRQSSLERVMVEMRQAQHVFDDEASNSHTDEAGR